MNPLLQLLQFGLEPDSKNLRIERILARFAGNIGLDFPKMRADLNEPFPECQNQSPECAQCNMRRRVLHRYLDLMERACTSIQAEWLTLSEEMRPVVEQQERMQQEIERQRKSGGN
jgi:predicted DsbA family dithiol-disulfide isomerase